jgi:hypothetical protein
MPKLLQRVLRHVRYEHHIATPTTIASRRTTTRHELLTTKRYRAVTPCTGNYGDKTAIYQLK